MIEDERGTFKKFWDSVNTAIRYLLGLLLFGFALGLAMMAIREANEPPSAATMTEVWYIYVNPCGPGGTCLPYVPPATYSSAETCETARDGLVKNQPRPNDPIEYFAYCESLLIE